MGYNKLMNVLREKLSLLPDKPGVYVMLDKNGQIIYVGKAKNLKNRVRQYFFSSQKSEKVMAMVSNIADFYYIIVPTEIDALSLENNLIKKHKPRYNVLLKDDKTYPYIKVNLKEEFPTFTITRKLKKDGAKYFGPYMGGVNANSVLEIINLVFKIRPCQIKIGENSNKKPCLNYHLKKCFAPCAGTVDKKEYRANVLSAIEFLSGDIVTTEKLLKEKMYSASEKQEFELAIKYKEKLDGIEKIKIKRITSLNRYLSADIIGVASNGIYTAVTLTVVRQGRMLGAKNYSFSCIDETVEETARAFVLSYYQKNGDFPEEIITSFAVKEGEVIQDYFRKNFEKTVKFVIAKQGAKKQLATLAEINAKEHLETVVNKINHKNEMTHLSCERLQKILKLNNYPKRMECYDISNVSGVDKVGSMVVFIDGEASKEDYRVFKIKTVQGADDFKSLQEVLSRRLERLKTDAEKFPKPDLVVIDGGKGQLSSVKEVFDKNGITDIDLISLAEREEEIFLPGISQPVVLAKSDYSLRLLQRIRDEAHRFALNYHRNLRSKRALSSVLDKVSGLGKIKRLALIERFKDVGNIATATVKELTEVNGIGENLAKRIISTLTEEGIR